MALYSILRTITKPGCKGYSTFLTNNHHILVVTKKTYLGLSNSPVIYQLATARPSTYTKVGKRDMSGDHSKVWPIEKLVTLGLIGVGPAAVINPSLVLDDILAVLLVTHMHWGLENAVVDYVRPIILGSKIPKLTMFLLYLLSFATLGGLLHYNHNCFGIGCTFRKLWVIKK